MDYSKTHYYKYNTSTPKRTRSIVPDFEAADEPMSRTAAPSTEEAPTVTPGFGPEGDVMPMLPSEEDQPAAPGFGPEGETTPSVPSEDNQPATPGFGPSGEVTPSLPGSSGTSNILWSWAFLSPLFSNISSIAQARFYNSTCIMEPIDIYLNNQLVVSDLAHAEYTDYLYIIPGYYTLTVYRRTNPGVPVLNVRVNFVRNSTCMVSILGSIGNFSVQFIC